MKNRFFFNFISLIYNPYICIKKRKQIPKNHHIMKPFLLTRFLIALFGLLQVISVTAQDELEQTKYAIVIDYQYDDALDFASNGLAAVKKDGKWGYIDKTGEVVVSPQYDKAENFSDNGLAAVMIVTKIAEGKDYRWGYINKTGRTIIDFQYDETLGFQNGLAGVKKGNKWGFIDEIGNLVINYQYEEVKDFTMNGLAAVKVSSSWGYINKNGTIIICVCYEIAESFSENGLAFVKGWDSHKRNYEGNYIDQTGKVVIRSGIANSYFDIGKSFAVNGLAAVEGILDRWGYIDETGETAIGCSYPKVWQFSGNGLALIKGWDMDSYEYINSTGKVVIELYKVDEARPFTNDGLAAVKKYGKWGFIDKTGNYVINNQYDDALNFHNGFAGVKKDGKWGYIYIGKPSDLISHFVQNRIEEWQQKGEFESPDAYLQRVTEDGRQKKADELTTVAVQKIAPDYCNWENLSATYDATITNQMFEVKVQGLLPFYVKVPNNGEAPAFKEALSRLQFTNVQYALNKDEQFFITKATIYNPDNYKKYRCQSSGVFEKKNIIPNFQPLDIQVAVENTQQVTTTEKNINIGLSDVDINIPENPQTNDKTFVVIIANENYLHETPVQYATNDGEVFRQYCEKTLGIPASHIRFNKDATFGTMRSEIRWACDIMEAFSGQAKVIFYYAGHGMPNTKDNSAYLLPSDGSSSDFEVAVKLCDLYSRLSSVPSQGVTVILDACFSGATRDNGILASVRSIGIVPDTEEPTGNMVVLSATTGNETASPYTEKRHGLFTYFLLKKLQETGGKVDYKTLSDYIIRNVTQQSAIDKNITKQTPVVNVSNDIRNSWGMWNFLK